MFYYENGICPLQLELAQVLPTVSMNGTGKRKRMQALWLPARSYISCNCNTWIYL